MLINQKFDIEVLAFEREYHSGRMPACPVHKLGRVKNECYYSRIPLFFKALFKIRKAANGCDVVYANGPDLAILSFISCLGMRKPIVVEIGDLARMQFSKGILSAIFRKIEGFFTSHYQFIVVISSGFLHQYYRSWLSVRTPGMVIENKLSGEDMMDLPVISKDRGKGERPLLERPLRIGYFGLLRDAWSYEILRALAEECATRFEIIFAGFPVDPSNLSELVKDSKNMTFAGEYRSPQDLPAIYGGVDMVWSCYPEIREEDYNFKWGRPNRFYEGCYFKKPFFARKGSMFADEVEKLSLGFVINDTDVGTVVSKIKRLNSNQYFQWKDAIDSLPKAFYMYDQEGPELAENIRSLKEE